MTSNQKKPRLHSDLLFDEVLSSALNEDRANRLLYEAIRLPPSEFCTPIHEIIRQKNSQNRIDPPTSMIWPSIVNAVLNGDMRMKEVEFVRYFSLSQDVLNLQEDHYLSRSARRLKQSCALAKAKWQQEHNHFPNVIRAAFTVVEDIRAIMVGIRRYFKNNEIVEDSADQKEKYTTCELSFPSDNAQRVTFLGSLCVLRIRGYTELHVADYLRMMYSKSMDLASCLLIAWLHSGVQLSPRFFEKSVNLLLHFFRYFQAHGNEAYTILKSFSGITDGWALAREEDWMNKDLLNETWLSLFEGGLVTCKDFEDSTLKTLIDDFETPELYEISGLLKLYGHPTINTMRGLKKLYSRTHKQIEISEQDSIELSNHLLKMYVQSHRAKHHGRWPIMNVTNSVKPAFIECILKNKWISDEYITRKFGITAEEEWNHVMLGHNQEFDYMDSVIPLLADKAVAITRSKVWNTCVMGGKMKLTERRVLLQYLFNEELPVEMRKYIREATNHDQEKVEACLEYLMIKVTQKEKELKVEGRFFGQSPLVERLRRVIIEKNTAGFLKKFCEHQAMTMTELERIKKLCMFARLHKNYPGHKIIQLSIDFEAWNNYFRHEIMGPAWRRILDGWYGVEFYENQMKTFSNSVIFHPMDKEFVWWEGQLGGIEGLLQYTWESVFVGMVTIVMEHLGYPFHMMSNGDDCRLAVGIPESEMSDPAKRVLELKEAIKDNTAKYGLSVKVSETYSSEKLIAFGQTYQMNGCWMPSLLKKGCKAHGYGNTIIPFLDQRIASSFSNSHSACAVGTTHNLMWLVAAMWCCWHFEADGKLADVHLKTLLMWPSVLGGYSVLPLYHMYVRGESDLLTVALSLYKYILSNHLGSPDLRECLYNILRIKVADPTKRKALILRDSYAINRVQIGDAKARLMSRVRSFIMKKTKNTELRQIFAAVTKEFERNLEDVLLSCSNYPARVMTEIFSCSPSQLADSIKKKFESARTVFQMLVMSGMRAKQAHRFFESLLRQDYGSRTKRIDILKGNSPLLGSDFCGVQLDRFKISEHNDLSCPTGIAQEARDNSWGMKITTVTYPCAVDMLYMVDPDDATYRRSDRENNNHFTNIYRGLNEFATQFKNAHYPYYTETPFIGAKTAEKIEQDFRITGDFSPSAQKVNNIIRILQHVNNTASNLDKILGYLFFQYTGEDFDVIVRNTSKRRSGTMTHRFACRDFVQSIMPNERPNRYAYVTTITDTNSQTRAQTGNWSINFLAVLCQDICTLLFELEYSGQLTTTWKAMYTVITPCQLCYQTVEDQSYMIKNPDEIMYWPSFPKVPSLVLSEAERQALYQELTGYRERHYSKFVIKSEADFERPELLRMAVGLLLDQFLRQSTIRMNFLIQHPEIKPMDEVVLSSLLYHLQPNNSVLAGYTEMVRFDKMLLLEKIASQMLGWMLERASRLTSAAYQRYLLTINPRLLPFYSVFELMIRTGKWNQLIPIIQAETHSMSTYYESTRVLDAQVYMCRALIPAVEALLMGREYKLSFLDVTRIDIYVTISETAAEALKTIQTKLPLCVVYFLNTVNRDEARVCVINMRACMGIAKSLVGSYKIIVDAWIDGRLEGTEARTRRLLNLERWVTEALEEEADAIHTSEEEATASRRKVVWLTKRLERGLLDFPFKPQGDFGLMMSKALDNPDEFTEMSQLEQLQEKLQLAIDGWNDFPPIALSMATYLANEDPSLEFLPGLHQLWSSSCIEESPELLGWIECDAAQFVINPFISTDWESESELSKLAQNLIEKRMSNYMTMEKWMKLVRSLEDVGIYDYSFPLSSNVRDFKVTVGRMDSNTAVNIIRSQQPSSLEDVNKLMVTARGEFKIEDRAVIQLLHPLTLIVAPSHSSCWLYAMPIEKTPPIVNIEPATIISKVITPTSCFPEYSSKIPTAWINRPFEMSTTACNKIIEIVLSLGIYKMMKNFDDLLIGCFADGAGGFTAAMLVLFPSSQVVFNTIEEQNRNTSYGVPHAVLNLDLEDKLRCMFEHNFTAPNDLRDQVCRDVLKAQSSVLNRNYSLITCDAEMSEGNRSDIFDILVHLLNDIADPETIVICKIVIAHHYTLVNFLVFLATYCKQVICVKPVTSVQGFPERYVVVRGRWHETIPLFQSDMTYTRRDNIRNIALRLVEKMQGHDEVPDGMYVLYSVNQMLRWERLQVQYPVPKILRATMAGRCSRMRLPIQVASLLNTQTPIANILAQLVEGFQEKLSILSHDHRQNEASRLAYTNRVSFQTLAHRRVLLKDAIVIYFMICLLRVDSLVNKSLGPDRLRFLYRERERCFGQVTNIIDKVNEQSRVFELRDDVIYSGQLTEAEAIAVDMLWRRSLKNALLLLAVK